MAWIESHQALLTHRKTIRAASILKVDRYKLIGHLHALWWWGIDNAEDDGSLGEAFPEELAEAAGWPGRNAVAFVNALVSVHFMDEVDGGGYRLHNWWNYAGKLNAKRAADRERKGGSRGDVARNSSGIPVERTRNSSGTDTEIQRAALAPTNQPTGSPSEIPTDLTNTTDQPTNLGARSLKSAWENRIGFLAFGDLAEFDEYARSLPEQWLLDAIEETAAKADRPSWAFCRKILQRCAETRQPPKQPPKATKAGSMRAQVQQHQQEILDRQHAEMEAAIAAGTWS